MKLTLRNFLLYKLKNSQQQISVQQKIKNHCKSATVFYEIRAKKF